jgi:hypothetical protein
MSTECDVILKWDATPQQLSAIGAALWRWCNDVPGDGGVSPHLNNQALADLIAGRLPESGPWPSPGEGRRVHFLFRDAAFRDRRAAIDSLRRELPAGGVAGVLVDGTGWDTAAEGEPKRVTAPNTISAISHLS